jgi:16S rRNA (adenine1518-N6/adenine1519-N6)-dimethyltransferase
VTSLMQEIKELGVVPQEALGQHFLIDQGIAAKIVRLADLAPDDWVVEIGPGMGVLTFRMLPLVKKVIAVELDGEMAAYLRGKGNANPSLIIIRQDVLGFDFARAATDAGRRIKVVANLPYNIATQIVFRLLDYRQALTRFTLMLQREVAQRIIAAPGGKAYGVLAIFTQLFTEPKIVMRVPPEAFYPIPRVESAVVAFDVLEQPRVTIEDEDFFKKLVKASFAQRRKTLLNALRGAPFPLSKEQIEQALLVAGIDPRRRAETLDLTEFQRLAASLKTA